MSGIIWGLLLVLIGLEILVRTIFGVDLPFIKIGLGLFLIYLGFTFLTDLHKTKHKKSFKFEKKYIVDTNLQSDYRTLFGESTIDLSQITLTSNKKIVIETIFGTTHLIVNPQIPTIITTDVVFGNGQFPDNTSITFGKYTYKTENYDEQPHLEIHTKVVFGNLIIKNL